MAASGQAVVRCERSEWRAVAWPVALLLGAFGAGWAYAAAVHGTTLGLPVALCYAIGLAWLARAAAGACVGSTAAMPPAALAAFRDRCFWSAPARCSYAAVLVCDGLFLLEQWPDQPAVFFVFAALAAAFCLRVSVLAFGAAAWLML